MIAILGQPATIVDLGAKKIYTFKNQNLKVTFVNGKATDIHIVPALFLNYFDRGSL